MPVTPTYPGVYVEEIPSGVRTITGVATSIAAFVDYFALGPMNKAVQVLSMADFERLFGGLHAKSEASYAIQQFFLNGGSEAWVVRVAGGGPASAEVRIGRDLDGSDVALTVTAISEGVWADRLRVRIDPVAPPAAGFNLTVTEYVTVGRRSQPARQEIFRGLSMQAGGTDFVETVINDPDSGSKLIRVQASGTNAPLANGTVSGVLDTPLKLSASPAVRVTIGAAPHIEADAILVFKGVTLPGQQKLTDIAPILREAIHHARPDAPYFTETEVAVDDPQAPKRLLIVPGGAGSRQRMTFQSAGTSTAADTLMLTTGVTYRLATLSGPHSVDPVVPSTPVLSVSIKGGPSQTLTLQLPTSPKLPDVGQALQHALRAAGPNDPHYSEARVATAGDTGSQRLIVLPGGTDPSRPFAFADVDGDTSATTFKLSGEATHRTVTLSGEQSDGNGPVLPAGPAVAVTVSDGTKDSSTIISLPEVSTPAQAAAALEAGIRAAYPGDAAFAGASVSVIGSQIRALAGPRYWQDRVFFTAIRGNPTASALRLTSDTHQLSGLLSGDLSSIPSIAVSSALNVAIGPSGAAPQKITFTAVPATLEDIRSGLETLIQGASSGGPLYQGARVFVAGDRLLIIPGESDPPAQVVFTEEGSGHTAHDLKLTSDATPLKVTRSGEHTEDPVLPLDPQVDMAIGSGTATASTIHLDFGSGAVMPGPQSLDAIRTSLEQAIRNARPGPLISAANVLVDGKTLLVVPGPGTPGAGVTFADTGSSPAADELRLTGKATANVQEYQLGGWPVWGTAQRGGAAGNDGTLPDAGALIGHELPKTGIYALEDVDLFNILCIPRVAMIGHGTDDLDEMAAGSVIAAAQDLCEKRRAFFLVDAPQGFTELSAIKSWLEMLNRHPNLALYYPRVKIPDPLNQFRLRSFGPSGTIAGLYARTDSARGVWKAPAGTEASLRNVSDLEVRLTDGQNGTLNPLAINCLRSFPVFGRVCWGARTLDGADQQASEWKYVPVRRIALFIEESLYRGTKWVVFEPNDEPLWAQIRLNVGAFMHNLFRQGAFQGRSPREAYFVKCDKETTTQNDINLGIVNILVGFAPLKPAEFVILQIQQMPGQIET